MARIDPTSVANADREAAGSGAEAIFLSCTNLRTLNVINDLEGEFSLPVPSSNLVQAWQMARLGHAPLAPHAPGYLARLRT
jgi:maleate isomerase